MSYRFMRIIVMFDLPTETVEDMRNYRKFRSMLIKNGFVMMQESVYTRMVLNQTVAKSVSDTVSRNKPPKGLVQLLTVTEKQFSKMEYIVGEYESDLIDTDERLVIL